jgi:hypothetical protein
VQGMAAPEGEMSLWMCVIPGGLKAMLPKQRGSEVELGGDGANLDVGGGV